MLYGVFLYMGVTSLVGIQFYDRVCLWFVWDHREWPQYPFVRKLPRKTIHLFTAFQLLMRADRAEIAPRSRRDRAEIAPRLRVCPAVLRHVGARLVGAGPRPVEELQGDD